MNGRPAASAFVLLALAGCTAPPSATPEDRTAAHDTRAGSEGSSGGVAEGAPLAFIDGRPVRLADLRGPLIEAAGGQVLSELLLQQAIEQRLAERGMTLTPEAQAAEETVFTAALDPD